MTKQNFIQWEMPKDIVVINAPDDVIKKSILWNTSSNCERRMGRNIWAIESV